jgi:hypothetical protein
MWQVRVRMPGDIGQRLQHDAIRRDLDAAGSGGKRSGASIEI